MTISDQDLQKAYRSGADAEPPRALDARILAAAHAELAKPKPRASWFNWLVPASVTAVAVVAVSLSLRVTDEEERLRMESMSPAKEVIRVEHERAPQADAAEKSAASVAEGVEAKAARNVTPAASALPSPSSTPARLAAPLATPPAARSAAEFATQGTTEPAGKPVELAPMRSAPAASVPFPESTPAAAARMEDIPSLRKRSATGKSFESDQSVEPVNRLRQAPMLERSLANPAAGDAAAKAESDAKDADEIANRPEAWLDEIRALISAGERERAAKALSLFRAAYPTHAIPKDLLDLF